MRAGFAVVSSVVLVGALAGVGAGVSSAFAAAEVPRGQVVANTNACMGCHAVDRKLVGPSFQQIAAKYKGDAQAPATLTRKVKEGGSGVWGMIPMPAHQSMSDADIRAVVDWVLTGAPGR